MRGQFQSGAQVHRPTAHQVLDPRRKRCEQLPGKLDIVIAEISQRQDSPFLRGPLVAEHRGMAGLEVADAPAGELRGPFAHGQEMGQAAENLPRRRLGISAQVVKIARPLRAVHPAGIERAHRITVAG